MTILHNLFPSRPVPKMVRDSFDYLFIDRNRFRESHRTLPSCPPSNVTILHNLFPSRPVPKWYGIHSTFSSSIGIDSESLIEHYRPLSTFQTFFIIPLQDCGLRPLKPERSPTPPRLRRVKAEEVGFEPTRALFRLKGLANPRNGPLCDSSI